MNSLHYFDIIIGSIILILGLKGLFRGFVNEIIGLLGLVLGVFLGSRFNLVVADFINENIYKAQNDALLKLIAFMVILATIWWGSIAIGSTFSKLVNMSGLGFLNNILGFITGGGKYFIIFALITAALSNIEGVRINFVPKVQNSILYEPLLTTGSYLINIDLNNIDFENISIMDINKTTEKSE
ncbi:MAG: CvpA family protein [Campylobacterales bacterium]|nr:CvpA family protein [Campylobacterales bacterium]